MWSHRTVFLTVFFLLTSFSLGRDFPTTTMTTNHELVDQLTTKYKLVCAGARKTFTSCMANEMMIRIFNGVKRNLPVEETNEEQSNSLLPCHLQHGSLDRLNFLFQTPPQKVDDSQSCCRKTYIKSLLLVSPDASRRQLIGQQELLNRRRYRRRHPLQTKASSVVQALPPISVPSPASGPALNSALESSFESSLSLGIPPAPEPAIMSGLAPLPAIQRQSPDTAPASSPDFYDYPSDDIPLLSFSPKSSAADSGVHPKNAPHKPSDGKKNHYNITSLILAIVLTGAASFFCAALIFFCCRLRRNYLSSESKRTDERPLLTLSIGDFSDGSSTKSYGFGSSRMNEKIGNFSLKNDENQFDSISSTNVNGGDEPSLAGTNATLGSLLATSLTLEENHVPKPPPTAPPPPPPAMPPVNKSGPPPPPPKPSGPRPPPLPKGAGPRPSHVGLGPGTRKPPSSANHPGNSEDSGSSNASKTKLKPFFWDKVVAKPDQSMVWHEISSGSFQFNEEMIESLFGYNSTDKSKLGVKDTSSNDRQPIRILDPKKSQNLAILLKALNVTTEEIYDALREGNELPNELLQSLMKMAPTPEEELKLRLYSDDVSLLGVAERFLKKLVEIPFAFKRLDALLLMGTLQEDISGIKGSFGTLEVACEELRSNRLFLKLLEAVLKTGNRMNDGTYRGSAQAFKLDTLLKLADVKGTDGKTTLLHFVVQEIIRSEGMRAERLARESGSLSSLNTEDLNDDCSRESEDHLRNLGLSILSGLGSELENVKKAAALDVDSLTISVANLGDGLIKTKEFLKKDMGSLEEDSGFYHSLTCFVEHAEMGITGLLKDEKKIRGLVKNTTDYFHGNAGKDEGLRMFVIVRDFLGMVDKVCREVKQVPKKVAKAPISRESSTVQQPVLDPRRSILFPAIRDQRIDTSSSDDDDDDS